MTKLSSSINTHTNFVFSYICWNWKCIIILLNYFSSNHFNKFVNQTTIAYVNLIYDGIIKEWWYRN